MLVAVNAVLTLTSVLQFGFHEIPCPLCLLQRVAFFGAGFGLISAFKKGYYPVHTACVLIFMIYLLVVSMRQSMNHIVEGQGGWIGGAIFGLHLSVWSVLFALGMLLLFSFQLAAVSVTAIIRRRVHACHYPIIYTLGKSMSWYLIILCAVNLVSVIFQCGFGICHTYGYVLL